MSCVSKSTNKYCYDLVLSLIQGSHGGDKTKWTPNNIRRLIISPDMAMVQHHVGGKISRKQFIPDKFAECSTSKDYIPMITALTDRVCSSVEEIVFCTRGQNGGVLNTRELELDSIIAPNKYAGTPAELRSAIMTRFKRLRGILILDCTIRDFYTTYMLKATNRTYQLSNDSDVRNNATTLIDFHIDDWYKGRYLRPDDYVLDSPDGVLAKHLRATEEQIESERRKREINKHKEDYIGSLKDMVQKQETNAIRVLSSVRRLLAVISTNEISVILQDADLVSIIGSCASEVSGLRLNDCNDLLSDRFRNLAKQFNIQITNNKVDSKEDAMLLAKSLESLCVRMYNALCKKFLQTLEIIGGRYPIMLRTKLSLTDRRIFIPSSLEAEGESASKYFESKLVGVSVPDSIANICWITCFLLLMDCKDSSVKKYYKKDLWKGVV